MRAFAELLDRLSLTGSRNAKLTLVRDYLRETPDPDRGWALAALTGDLSFDAAKPAFIRKAVEERMAPQPTGRWALLKLMTGALRVGLTARLAKRAAADMGAEPVPVAEVEDLWHALHPPYEDLFAWLEGRADKPSSENPGRFRPAMLAQAIDEAVDFAKLDPADYAAEWKWDGIRVQAVNEGGVRRLYTRTGDDISRTFPDVVDALSQEGVSDGELLVLRDGHVASFADLQQRLNRKSVDAKLMAAFPAGVRAYDILAEGAEDTRVLPFA